MIIDIKLLINYLMSINVTFETEMSNKFFKLVRNLLSSFNDSTGIRN